MNENILSEFAHVINSDRYQYTESHVFLKAKMEEKVAVFDMYFRKTENRGFAVISGVQEVLRLVEVLNNTNKEEKRKYFSKIIDEDDLLEYLVDLKFTGELYGMRDGEIAYPNEPIITIKAPLIQAKILETPILNIMNMQMAIATKASMITRAAYPTPVLSFGSRRAHGFSSAVEGNKAAYIGGCLTHSNIMTEYKYGIKSVGTMAHSFIQTFGVGQEAEKQAFNEFVKSRKEGNNPLILLIDTYNTKKMGIKNAIESFKENKIDDSYEGTYGIRIDSGDLAYLSKFCRKELDKAGLKKAQIVLTNGLDEKLIKALKEQGAEVDSYGVGDAIAVSKSNPCFGGVYKIVEVDDEAVIKLSEDIIKISNPGFKEVYRIYDKNGLAYADLITLKSGDSDKNSVLENKSFELRDEKYEFKKVQLRGGDYSWRKLTKTFIKDGVITEEYNLLKDVKKSRERYIKELEKVAYERRRLDNPHKYKVDLSSDLIKLKYKLINKISKQIAGDDID